MLQNGVVDDIPMEDDIGRVGVTPISMKGSRKKKGANKGTKATAVPIGPNPGASTKGKAARKKKVKEEVTFDSADPNAALPVELAAYCKHLTTGKFHQIRVTNITYMS